MTFSTCGNESERQLQPRLASTSHSRYTEAGFVAQKEAKYSSKAKRRQPGVRRTGFGKGAQRGAEHADDGTS